MTARPIPTRHWRSYGSDPLPTPAEALSAFPSWFLRSRATASARTLVNEAHTSARQAACLPLLARAPIAICQAMFTQI
jgi:hypothetical protein